MRALALALLPAAVGLVLAGGAVALRQATATQTGQGRLLSVEATSRVAAGTRVSFYAAAAVDAGARVLVRLCTSDYRCLFERFEPIGPESGTKWIAAGTVPVGTYRLEVYLQMPTAFGYRSVDTYVATVTGE